MVKGGISPSAQDGDSETVDITVSVTDGENSIEGASVTLTDNEDNDYTGTTGSAGGCTLRNVPTGTYEVVATKNGYVDYESTLTVTNETTTLNIIMEENNSTPEPSTYYFASYDDDQGTNLWGKGTVQLTGVIESGYTEVEVLTNSTDESFVGQKFFIASEANADASTLYPLYSDAGTTSAGIYVKISEEEIQ